MTRYFFDITQNGEGFPDAEGSDLSDVAAARREALETLCEFATDHMAHEGERHIVIEVREHLGPAFLTGELPSA